MRDLLGISVLVNVLLGGWLLVQHQQRPAQEQVAAKKGQSLEELFLTHDLETCINEKLEILDAWEADINRRKAQVTQVVIQADLPSFQEQRLQREMAQFFADENRAAFLSRYGLPPY